MAKDNGSFIENIAFLEQAKSSALGLVTSKKGVNFNEADLLLNQLEGTINREKQTLKTKISNELEDNSIQARYQIQDMKEMEKDVDTQIGFLLDERAININREIEKRKNDSMIKRGYTLTPDELDNTMLELTEDYMGGVPKDKQGQFKQTLNKIYSNHKQEVDNNYVKMVRENAKQVAEEHISNIPTLYDISNPDTLRNVINQTSKKFQGVFDSNNGKNRELIENGIVSSLSNLIKPENTKEQNDKIYNSMKTYLTTQNGSVIPGNINPKLGEVIDTKYKVILNQAKENEENQNKLFQIGLDDTLDNLEINDKTPETILKLQSITQNQINKINNSKYLNTLEKQETIKKMEKNINKLNLVSQVSREDLVTNALKMNDFEQDKKKIVENAINNKAKSLIAKNDFNGLSNFISKIGIIPTPIKQEISLINSQDINTIGNTVAIINEISKSDNSILNLMDKDEKIKYFVYSADISLNKNITPLNVDVVNKYKENKNIVGIKETSNDFENNKFEINGTKTNAIKFLSQNEFQEDKERYEILKKARGKEFANVVFNNMYSKKFTIASDLLIEDSNIGVKETEQALDFFIKDNKINKDEMKQYTFKKVGEDLIAFKTLTFKDKNKKTQIIKTDYIEPAFSIKNFDKLHGKVMDLKRTDGEYDKYFKEKKDKEDKEEFEKLKSSGRLDIDLKKILNEK